MELGVLLLAPLASDVAPDLAFAAVLADRTEVGPVGPELPTPQERLDGGDPPEDFSGGETLDDPGELAGAVRRNRLHEAVHVVPVGPELQKRNVVPGGNLQTDVPEGRVHLGRSTPPDGTSRGRPDGRAGWRHCGSGGCVCSYPQLTTRTGRGKPRGINPQRMNSRKEKVSLLPFP